MLRKIFMFLLAVVIWLAIIGAGGYLTYDWYIKNAAYINYDFALIGEAPFFNFNENPVNDETASTESATTESSSTEDAPAEDDPVEDNVTTDTTTSVNAPDSQDPIEDPVTE